MRAVKSKDLVHLHMLIRLRSMLHGDECHSLTLVVAVLSAFVLMLSSVLC